MAEIKNVKPLFRVDIIESERGWGSRVDEVKYFETMAEANAFCNQYNSHNTAAVTPDWYMYADYRGPVAVTGIQ